MPSSGKGYCHFSFETHQQKVTMAVSYKISPSKILTQTCRPLSLVHKAGLCVTKIKKIVLLSDANEPMEIPRIVMSSSGL
jgi:hypothetical protein